MRKEMSLTLGINPMVKMDVFERDDTGRIVGLLHSREWPASSAVQLLLNYCDGDTSVLHRDLQEILFSVRRDLHDIAKQAAQFAHNYRCSLGPVNGRLTPSSGFVPLSQVVGKGKGRGLGNSEMADFLRDVVNSELRKLSDQGLPPSETTIIKQ